MTERVGVNVIAQTTGENVAEVRLILVPVGLKLEFLALITDCETQKFELEEYCLLKLTR